MASPSQPSDDAPSFQIGGSIPVLRMLDEQSTRTFYGDLLNFTIDWEHRFHPHPDSTLYMQIHWGQATVHLNGHVDDSSPTTEVRLPVDCLDSFCRFVNDRLTAGRQINAVDPRGTGAPTEVNLYDPSGNLLVFWHRPDETR
ncbi:MAG: glyoxalase superfamily protein [Planctomycetaceae bacterium]|nr:glyoxalase superfamily protein [Planctomycetaceae bacterium]